MQNLRAPLRRSVAASVMLSAALLGACSDATSTAPNPLSGYITNSSAIMHNGEIELKTKYPKYSNVTTTQKVSKDTTIETFKIDAGKSILVKFGKHATQYIAIPSGALCDPSTSGYGPSVWLSPCAVATKPLTMTVKSWTDASGHPHADFSPNVRFSPSAAAVTIYFADQLLLNYSQVIIPYCDDVQVCVNEGLTDPALETYVSSNSTGGFWVFRQLRHFSGYNVTAY